jgi:hypothetical protein
MSMRVPEALVAYHSMRLRASLSHSVQVVDSSCERNLGSGGETHGVRVPPFAPKPNPLITGPVREVARSKRGDSASLGLFDDARLMPKLNLPGRLSNIRFAHDVVALSCTAGRTSPSN